MERKIILKPTDYIQKSDGKLCYSYDYESQYSDGEWLNSLSEKELSDECKKRWKSVQSFPIPSNVSRYSLARDLALAKGFDIGKHNNKTNEGQREF